MAAVWTDCGWRWRSRRHHARVRIIESPELIRVECNSDDQMMHVAIDAQPRQDADLRSVFRPKHQLMRILLDDMRGLPFVARRPRRDANLQSDCHFRLVPLQVENLESSVFTDPARFPDGAAEYDSAYWLRDDEVVWSEQGAVCFDCW